MKIWIAIGLCFIAIITYAVKTDLMSKILFSNKSYAKNIEVKTYILTQEQVTELFKESEKEPVLLTAKELNTIEKEKRYCVIKLKNLNNLHAWGVLSCKIPGINGKVLVEIPCIRNYYCNYIICISGCYVSTAENSLYPEIYYKWSKLYTK